VTAMGKIVAPTREMAVGSPEGGLVARVFVHPYDLVKEGDPLVELDRAAPEADMNRLAYAEASARADVIRLEAELKGSIPDVSGLPAEIAQAARATWEARTKKHADQVAAKEAEIQALRGLQDSYVKSLAAKEEVLNRLQEGVADGGVARNRVDGQRSEVAEYRGRVSKGVADIGNVTAQIAALRSTDIESAYKDLNEARLKQRDAEQQLHKAQAQERHMTLRAPATGQIKTLTAMGPGMAVKPGETVVEIVEASDIHRIDALLPAEDGANVRVGDLVRVSLDKDDGTHDGFDGHILAIAPGSVADNKSGQLKMAIEVSVEAEAFPSRVNGVAVPIKDGVPVRVEGELARRSFFTIVLGRLFGMHDNLSRGS